MNTPTKESYIDFIKSHLLQFPEIKKIVIFGSFFKTKDPNDIDIAIVQDSNNNFLTLSLKYRKALRELSKKIALDIVPLKKDFDGFFAEEIQKGRIIYER